MTCRSDQAIVDSLLALSHDAQRLYALTQHPDVRTNTTALAAALDISAKRAARAKLELLRADLWPPHLRVRASLQRIRETRLA